MKCVNTCEIIWNNEWSVMSCHNNCVKSRLQMRIMRDSPKLVVRSRDQTPAVKCKYIIKIDTPVKTYRILKKLIVVQLNWEFPFFSLLKKFFILFFIWTWHRILHTVRSGPGAVDSSVGRSADHIVPNVVISRSLAGRKELDRES